jgi:hypothetical protein
MPAERLKNTATDKYDTTFLGSPAGQSCHQFIQRTSDSLLEPNLDYPVDLKITNTTPSTPSAVLAASA